MASGNHPHDLANPPRANRLSPRLVFAVWTVPTLLSTLETVMFSRMANRPISVIDAFLGEAPQWYSWALFTPLIVLLGERAPLRLPLRWRNVGLHAVASLSMSWCVAMADAAVNLFIRPSRVTFLRSATNWFVSGLPATTVAYFAIIGLSYAVGNAVRLRRREAQLRDAQLAALRMQLQPHFLFNSLNAIMALVRDQDTTRAVRALSLLADVLRATINAGDAATTTLAEEIAFVERYLDIERVRFGDRLRVVIDVPPELRPARVPTFLLQPFVENALKHGVLHDRGANEIAVTARNGDKMLTLTVRDDGRGLPGAFSAGVGITNARARLEGMYGGDASLVVMNANPGVEVRVRIPLVVS